MIVPEKVQTTILAPDGTVANLPTTFLTGEEAMLLRAYKKFLNAHGLKEALYCNACYEQNLAHGTRAFVTDDQILIQCRCRVRFHKGQTF
jgi:hypothetical protein